MLCDSASCMASDQPLSPELHLFDNICDRGAASEQAKERHSTPCFESCKANNVAITKTYSLELQCISFLLSRYTSATLHPFQLNVYHRTAASGIHYRIRDLTPSKSPRATFAGIASADTVDGFYRCCHRYSNRPFISPPEFGSASGKVDFQIPCRKWGVELLGDANGLENHSSRFTGQGAYVKMSPIHIFSLFRW